VTEASPLPALGAAAARLAHVLLAFATLVAAAVLYRERKLIAAMGKGGKDGAGGCGGGDNGGGACGGNHGGIGGDDGCGGCSGGSGGGDGYTIEQTSHESIPMLSSRR
jgi:hypothetical protein